MKFLWAASKGSINPLPCTPDGDDPELTAWGIDRHTRCILSTTHLVPTGHPPYLPTGNDPALHELASNIKSQTLVLEKMRQDKSEEKGAKKWESLHESSKRMILHASSTNGESTPSNPGKLCSEFYNKTTVGKVMDFLATTLKEEQGCIIDLSPGLVSALLSGKFVRDREDSPNNFSFFMVPKMKPLSSGHA